MLFRGGEGARRSFVFSEPRQDLLIIIPRRGGGMGDGAARVVGRRCLEALGVRKPGGDELGIESVMGAGKLGGASVEAGGGGMVAAGLVEHGVALERVDLVRVLFGKLLAKALGFVEPAGAELMDHCIGELVEVLDFGHPGEVGKLQGRRRRGRG